MQDHDIIIIGAGVAGCRLAALLGDTGLDVLLLEKDRQIRLKDSGVVSPRFTGFFGARHVSHNIYEMDIVSPSGKKFSVRSVKPFAHIIDREKFSAHLRREARKHCTVRYEFVKDIKITPYSALVSTNNGVYTAKIVIGADGASSVTRRSLKIKPPKLYAGLLVRTKKKIMDTGGAEYERINVFMNKFYSPDFFAWIIPQTNEYGLITAVRPWERFEYFKRTLCLPEGEKYSYPVASGFTTSYARRALLLGDACGANKPVTGGGIVFSLITANLAADAIKAAFEARDFTSPRLAAYQEAWRAELSGEIRKQMFFRRVYRKMSNRDIDVMFDYIKPHAESIRDFDYDELSQLHRHMPKWKLLRFMLPRIKTLL